MIRIPVTAGGGYDVLIEEGLLAGAGALLAELTEPCRVAVLSDSNVLSLYGQAVEQSLAAAGFSPVSCAFPAGEASKNLNTYAQLLDFLAEKRIDRRDLILALGGGVVGDMAGFAAATWLRGIRFVQVPTSLLAMVDSSVGGKTAVDLPAGKNLVGAFHQPSLVICDPALLGTLPEDVFRDGCGEVVKYAMLGSPALFRTLEERPIRGQTEAVIARCIEMKRDYVEADELDTGARQKLNLGHSFGHAIERLSRYQIPHGQAVAIGTVMITAAAIHFGLCPEETLPRLTALLERNGLPTDCPYPAEAIAQAMLSDKKLRGGHLNLIVPTDIGRCEIRPTALSALYDWAAAGGAKPAAS